MAASKKKPAKGVPAKGPPAVSSGNLIADLIEGMRADIGEENVQLLGSDGNLLKIKGVISTQCPTLDAAIGRGGVPLGRLTLLHGAEGCGKTTLALHLAAECHRRGGLVVYFDKEYKLDPDYAKSLGVDLNRVIISQPRTLEQVIDGTKKLISMMKARRLASGKQKPVVVIWDSINAMKAKDVLDDAAGDHHIAPEARLWSKHMPSLIEEASKESIALVGISQVRKKINVMFGDGDDMAGGQAPRFYASLIMKIIRVGSEKDGEGKKIANKIEAECKKNQIAPPFRKAMFQIKYGSGIDFDHSLLLQLIDMGHVTQGKGGVVFDGVSIGKGIQSAAIAVGQDDALRARLNKLFRQEMGW